MAKPEGYAGSVSLISGITPKGDSDIALVHAHYIQIDKDGKRLDEILTEGGGSIGGDNADAIPYTNEVDEAKNTVGAALDDLYKQISDMNYKPITISASVDKSVNEMGATVNQIVVSWSPSKTPKKLKFNGTDETDPTIKSKTLKDLALKTDTSYSVEVTDERGKTASASAKVTFVNGVYYGATNVNTADDITNDIVSKLDKKVLTNTKARTITVTPGLGEYIIYALPTRLGTPEFIVSGFSGGFGTEPVKRFEFTNTSGYKESYDVWVSDNPDLGETTIIIK